MLESLVAKLRIAELLTTFLILVIRELKVSELVLMYYFDITVVLDKLSIRTF